MIIEYILKQTNPTIPQTQVLPSIQHRHSMHHMPSAPPPPAIQHAPSAPYIPSIPSINNKRYSLQQDINTPPAYNSNNNNESIVDNNDENRNIKIYINK